MVRLVVVVLIAGLAAPVLAQAPGPAPAGTVGPTQIPGQTREQKLAAIGKALRAMDSNGDERITSAEWTAAGGKKAGFATLDTNKDDVLTLQELRSNARKLRAFEDFQAAALY